MNNITDTGSYKIYTGDTVFTDLNTFISNSVYSAYFILTDENTSHLCLPLIKDNLANKTFSLIQIKSGEEHKNLETCTTVWNRLIEAGADRNALLINLGGGVIGDLGGFAASTYKRGIDFINIPTTLLAQVDASVGGKLGVDLNSIKNIVGLFANPKAVFIFPGFYHTLPERQLLSGFAEIIKHGLVFDRAYWSEIKNGPKDFAGQLNSLIRRSVEIKNEVVSIDPFEKGLRKILNFGHTIGHALETFSLLNDSNPLLHGEAVAAGMICEAYLSCRVSGLSKDSFAEISSFIDLLYKRYSFNHENIKELLHLMQYDKKNQNNNINFSLLSEPGKCEINISCDEALITESLNYYLSGR